MKDYVCVDKSEKVSQSWRIAVAKTERVMWEPGGKVRWR